MVSRLKPPLATAERAEMESLGLIRLEKRGRAKHIVLTEKAWIWSSENLNAEISQSKFAVIALKGVLKSLSDHIARNRISLAEFAAPLESEAEKTGPEPVHMEKKITAAYLGASGGKTGVRVRLADMMPFLKDIPKTIVDDELKRMQIEGLKGLVLWPLDDPQDISPEDERAALYIAGSPRHIVYMEA